MKRTIILKATNTDKVIKNISVVVKVNFQQLTQGEVNNCVENLKDAFNDLLRQEARMNQSDIKIL